ncbi:MAG: YbbC/YhhH family protein [Paludibacter sp.]|nr:YbbC/YhhH family protein [Paludibacter sp.]
MKKEIIIIVIFFSVFSVNCSNRTENTNTNTSVNSNNQEVTENVDYVVNKNLDTIEGRYTGLNMPREGIIPNAEIAYKIAQTLFYSFFDNKMLDSEKPFQVNLKNGVWIIEGDWKGRVGGVAYIEIQQSDGKILTFNHTK